MSFTIDSAILAPAHAHEAFELVIRSGARRRISEYFAMESEALMCIWRGLAISLACVMAVLIKLPARTMHSLAGGGERVKPIGAENSDKECMSSTIQSIRTTEIQDGENLLKMLASACQRMSAKDSFSCWRSLYASLWH